MQNSYLVKTYQYPCLIQLSAQVEKQYDAMPEVFKNIYSYNEKINGGVYQSNLGESVTSAYLSSKKTARCTDWYTVRLYLLFGYLSF